MDNNQHRFGNYMPSHIKEALEQAKQAKQPQPNEQGEVSVQPTDTQVNEPAEQAQQPIDTTPNAEPQDNQPDNTVPNSAEDNDVKAWKGRLKKAQAEQQQINAKLVEEAEKREKLEAELAQMKALVEQAKSISVEKVHSQTNPTGLSADEIEELGLVNPVLKAKLLELQQAETQPQQMTQPSSVPVQHSVTQTPQSPAQQAQPSQVSVRDRVWYEEVQRVIPEMQGLLADPKFVAFASGNTDRLGKTDLDLIQEAGQVKDVSYLPALREIIDEFNQSKMNPPPAVTVAPQKNATVKARVTTPKTMTKKDEAHAEMLARTGKTAELRKFLAQFTTK